MNEYVDHCLADLKREHLRTQETWPWGTLKVSLPFYKESRPSMQTIVNLLNVTFSGKKNHTLGC